MMMIDDPNQTEIIEITRLLHLYIDLPKNVDSLYTS